MKVRDAKAAAVDWVMQYASEIDGFKGAYFSGSTIKLLEDDELPASSDVDIVVVISQTEAPLKLGKFLYCGVLLEVTYLSWNEIALPEAVLASYHLEGSFRVNTIIADPTGHLTMLYEYISKQYSRISWVSVRCDNVISKIKNGLQSIDLSAAFHDQVTSWLFPTGITTHAILVAALRNPTVRLRYVAAKQILKEYGHIEFYHQLIELLGCAQMTPQCLEKHLDELSRTFDAAARVSKTPFFFSTDITPIARPIAIDGSRELIKTGYHHEAVFWITATFARCHKILQADGPAGLQHELYPAFESLMTDLGISSVNDIIVRADGVMRFLPGLNEIVEDIKRRNPEIVFT